MIPTIQFLTENFIRFNNEFFGNKLSIPKFKIGTTNGYWGMFVCDGTYSPLTRRVKTCKHPTIEMTNAYDRNKKDVLNTLLHEMIHYYITSVLRVIPEEEHGYRFKKLASKVNSFGWNVTESDIIKKSDIPVKA